MKTYTKQELSIILDNHAKWLRGYGGERADLSDANLIRANLRRADLSNANLIRANLSDADMSNANLIRADLSNANLIRADLSNANLSDANLSGADLIDANLSGANLSNADLIRANLRRADLSNANLIDANLSNADLIRASLSNAIGAELALARCSHLPEGEFTAWKKCKYGVIVKLCIPEDAKRSHGAGRKCRAERALVVDVIGADFGVSMHDETTEYHKGQMVEADAWCDDRWQECAPGIHFFITRLEAEAYGM